MYVCVCTSKEQKRFIAETSRNNSVKDISQLLHAGKEDTIHLIFLLLSVKENPKERDIRMIRA